MRRRLAPPAPPARPAVAVAVLVGGFAAGIAAGVTIGLVRRHPTSGYEQPDRPFATNRPHVNGD